MSKFSQSIPVVPAVPEGERLSGLYDHMNRSFGLSESEISVVRAPLRICPVGAHIDHQLGVVTGMTINESVLLAFAPTNDGTVRIQSSQFDTEVSFQLDHVPPFEAGDWGNYIRGAVIALRDQYELSLIHI